MFVLFLIIMALLCSTFNQQICFAFSFISQVQRWQICGVTHCRWSFLFFYFCEKSKINITTRIISSVSIPITKPRLQKLLFTHTYLIHTVHAYIHSPLKVIKKIAEILAVSKRSKSNSRTNHFIILQYQLNNSFNQRVDTTVLEPYPNDQASKQASKRSII